jgi:hypothetical protein
VNHWNDFDQISYWRTLLVRPAPFMLFIRQHQQLACTNPRGKSRANAPQFPDLWVLLHALTWAKHTLWARPCLFVAFFQGGRQSAWPVVIVAQQCHLLLFLGPAFAGLKTPLPLPFQVRSSRPQEDRDWFQGASQPTELGHLRWPRPGNASHALSHLEFFI